MSFGKNSKLDVLANNAGVERTTKAKDIKDAPGMTRTN